jgi:hypothetical protein
MHVDGASDDDARDGSAQVTTRGAHVLQPVRLDKIMKELAAVSAQLRGQRVNGAARLELLRRQAALGDRRDAALDAERRRAAPPR